MAIQALVRQVIPLPLRRWLRVQYRHLDDKLRGRHYTFVPLQRYNSGVMLPPAQLSVQQSIIPGPGLTPKLTNMQLAIARLEGVPIPSGQVLSFWRLVGVPSARQGYQAGRNIINGQLSMGYGGGLCQLSSAIYELALRAGMPVLERHPHSTNVYTPQTAYTPLGLDATLAYGYKDLRLQNPWPFPLYFSFNLAQDCIQVSLCATEPIPAYSIRVDQQPRQQHGNALTARVYRQEPDGERLLTTDWYAAADLP